MSKRKAISAVIPTYNKLKLLENNLSSLFHQLNMGDEVIVVDDAGTDETKDVLINKYNLLLRAEVGDKYGNFELYEGDIQNHIIFKLLVNKKNLRFARSCNRGVDAAKNSLVFLLNNDVRISKGAVDELIKNFNNSKLFAVGCFESEPNRDNASGGKNELWFEKGLFHHSRAKTFESGDTAWASGGSAMFSREKWLELGGFDLAYYPAYWEDIDLSTRAKKKGWLIQFCAQAKVIHEHESTNLNEFGQEKIKQTSWKHADYFTMKHGNPAQKVQFLLYRPYWWFKRLAQSPELANKFSLIAILLLAIILRFYKLAQVPAGMTWDEAAIGYNGYAVIKTRHDEWLNRLPVSFKSFGDYKAPLAIYATGVITSLFGLNLWVLRAPFALSGVLGVLGMIKLSEQLLLIHYSQPKKNSVFSIKTLSLISGLFLACSPWHLQFTRVGFESGLALTLVIWGVYFFALSLRNSRHKPTKKEIFLLLMGILFFVGSMYAYHSTKLFVPLLTLFAIIIHRKIFFKNFFKMMLLGAFSLLLLLPMLIDSFFGEGLTRGGSLIIGQAGSVIELTQMITTRLLAHVSPAFLIGGWSDTLRHGTSKHSVFLLIVFIFILIGFFSLIKTSLKIKKMVPWFKLSILWIILGLLPAVLGEEYPQSNRALLALPGFIWLGVIGLKIFIDGLTNGKLGYWLRPKMVSVLIGIIFLINLSMYLHHYYYEFANSSADDFNEGYLQTMELVYQYERGVEGKPEVKQIIFSDQYGQPYIYALFVRKTNPIWYQGGSLVKYKFVDKVKPSDLDQPNSLIVATERDEMTDSQPTQIIYAVGGQRRFRLYYTGQQD